MAACSGLGLSIKCVHISEQFSAGFGGGDNTPKGCFSDVETQTARSSASVLVFFLPVFGGLGAVFKNTQVLGRLGGSFGCAYDLISAPVVISWFVGSRPV